MLRISKNGEKLYFIPPDKSNEQELDFPLIYGHTCPKCNNLIQALFTTDRKIDPKPWEEIMTKQLDSTGHFKRIIPGRHERYHSRYTSHIIGRGNAVSAQLIRFASHFDPKDDVISTPICDSLAISTSIPEYRIGDILLATGLDPSKYTFKDKDYAGIRAKLETGGYPGMDIYRFVEAVGDGPELVLVNRQNQQWILNMAVNQFMKPYTPPVVSY